MPKAYTVINSVIEPESAGEKELYLRYCILIIKCSMKASISNLTLAVCITFILTGCASILNGKYQSVMIRTNSDGAKVYVDGDQVGKGKYVTARMKRDRETRQIKVEREGYKPEYQVHYQQKKSPLYIMSWIPFAVLFYPPFYDNGPKSFNYLKEASVSCETKIVSKESGQKYVYLNKTAFDIGKEDLIVRSYRHKKYKKNKNSFQTDTNNKEISLDNSVFTKALNEVLKEYGYTDTTHSVLRSNTNTVYVNADVNKITFDQVFTSGYSSFLVAEASIDWEILDIYNIPKYKVSITARSGEFSNSYYDDDDHMAAAIEDAITASFFELLNKKEVKDLIQIEAVDQPDFAEMQIAGPSKSPKDLEGAQASTVTIAYENGHGSGCVVSKDGYIITNYHVVAGKKDMDVIFSDGSRQKAEFVRANEFADLALIKIDKNTAYAFKITDARNYKSGEEVFAIGTPSSIELGQTLSKGIVSGVRKNENRELIQTDVSVNPGNSGGALVNRKGELVGVVNSKLIGVGIEGIAFCIPAKDILSLLSISYGNAKLSAK